MDEAGFGALVERIYDMALDVAQWPQLLEHLARAFNAHAGSLTRENMETHTGGGFAVGLDPSAPGRYFDYYASCNVVRKIANPRERMRNFTPIVTVDQDSLPKRDLLESEFYVDFLRPTDIHSMMTIGLWGRGMEVCALDLYRSRARPDFEEPERRLAEALQPHLIRAFRLGDRLEGLKDLSQGLAAGLERAPYGYFLLDRAGRVRHVNPAGQRLLKGGGIAMVGGRLTAIHPSDARRLEALIGGCGGPSAGNLAIRRGDGRSPLAVVVAPVSPERGSPLSPSGGVAVWVTDPQAGTELPQTRLRQVFGLTDAQSRVALALYEGKSLRETAEALNLSIFTVRAHLAQIFTKTETSRQAELVSLLSRAATNGGFA